MGLSGLWAFLLRSSGNLLQRLPEKLPSVHHIVVDVPNVGRLKDGVDLADLLRKLENTNATVYLAVDFGGNFVPLTRTATLVASRLKSSFKDIIVVGANSPGTADEKIVNYLRQLSPDKSSTTDIAATRGRPVDPTVLVVSADTDLLLSLSLSQHAHWGALVIPPNASILQSSDPFGRSARLLRANTFASFVECGQPHAAASPSRAALRLEFALVASLVGRAEVGTESSVVIAALNAIIRQNARAVDGNKLRAASPHRSAFVDISGRTISIFDPPALGRFLAPFAREGAAAADTALTVAASTAAAACVRRVLNEMSHAMAPGGPSRGVSESDGIIRGDVGTRKVSGGDARTPVSLAAISQWLLQCTDPVDSAPLPTAVDVLVDVWGGSTLFDALSLGDSSAPASAASAAGQASTSAPSSATPTPASTRTPPVSALAARASAPARFADEIMKMSAASSAAGAGAALRASVQKVQTAITAAREVKADRSVLAAAVRSMKRTTKKSKGKGDAAATDGAGAGTESAVGAVGAAAKKADVVNLAGVGDVGHAVMDFADSDDDAPPKAAKAQPKAAPQAQKAKQAKQASPKAQQAPAAPTAQGGVVPPKAPKAKPSKSAKRRDRKRVRAAAAAADGTAPASASPPKQTKPSPAPPAPPSEPSPKAAKAAAQRKASPKQSPASPPAAKQSPAAVAKVAKGPAVDGDAAVARSKATAAGAKPAAAPVAKAAKAAKRSRDDDAPEAPPAKRSAGGKVSDADLRKELMAIIRSNKD